MKANILGNPRMLGIQLQPPRTRQSTLSSPRKPISPLPCPGNRRSGGCCGLWLIGAPGRNGPRLCQTGDGRKHQHRLQTGLGPFRQLVPTPRCRPVHAGSAADRALYHRDGRATGRVPCPCRLDDRTSAVGAVLELSATWATARSPGPAHRHCSGRHSKQTRQIRPARFMRSSNGCTLPRSITVRSSGVLRETMAASRLIGSPTSTLRD